MHGVSTIWSLEIPVSTWTTFSYIKSNVNDCSMMDPYLEESWFQASEAMTVEFEGV